MKQLLFIIKERGTAIMMMRRLLAEWFEVDFHDTDERINDITSAMTIVSYRDGAPLY